MSSAIALKSLTKQFASSENGWDNSIAVDDVTLEVGEREFLVLVGPGGCGKSTIMRLIAGLETPTSGDIYINGHRVNDIPVKACNVGLMFQGYALFKHMTVADNIGFGLKIRGVSKRERQHRIGEMVSLMGLEGLEDWKPDQLSGDHQQRVALARAIAPRPKLLLLDEPFGASDAKVRRKLRSDTKKWQQELGIPTILVTHDQREALEMGERVAVMNAGHIEQVDAPHQVYDSPTTEFVARFIGRVNGFSPELGRSYGGLIRGTPLEIMVRPEDITIHSRNGTGELENGQIPSTVASYNFLGRTVRLDVQMGNGSLVTVAVPKHQALAISLEPGTPVALTMDSCQVFPVNGHV